MSPMAVSSDPEAPRQQLREYLVKLFKKLDDPNVRVYHADVRESADVIDVTTFSDTTRKMLPSGRMNVVVEYDLYDPQLASKP